MRFELILSESQPEVLTANTNVTPNKSGILKYTTAGFEPARVIKPYVPAWERPSIVYFRIPSIAAGYVRVSALTSSLTNQFSPDVHVYCPPVCLFLVC